MSADYRVSPQQRSQWPARPERRFDAIVGMRGALDRTALVQALTRLVARHESLRTTFHVRPGMSLPVQSIRAAETPSLDDVDLTKRTPIDRENELDAIFEAQSQRRFALEDGAPMHLTLVALAEDRHALVVSLPALTADAQSLDVFVRDLAHGYAEAHGGARAGDLPVQYADVASVMNDLLESEETEAGRRYWLAQKGDAGERANDGKLAAEAVAIDDARVDLRAEPWIIDADLAASLDTLAMRCDAPLPIVLFACWQALLTRLGDTSSSRVSALYEGRSYEGLENAIGAFERYLPFANVAVESSSLRAITQALVRTATEAGEWQDYFDPKQADGNQPRAFSFEDREGPIDANGVTFAVDRSSGCSARFALKLACVRRGGVLRAAVSYDAALFAIDEARRIAPRLSALIHDAAARPDVPLADLSILSAEDLAFFAAQEPIARDYPRDRTIHSLFEEQARKSPDAIALVCGDDRVTFDELNTRANQVAHYLLSLDVGPEVCVGLCLDRSIELVVALLGILKSGGAYVPLDPAYPKERLAFILEEARIRIVLTQHDLVEALPEGCTRVCLDDASDAIARAAVTDPPSTSNARNLAYVIYTSGSTGKPKGVMIEHHSLANLATALEDAIYREREAPLVVTMSAPVSFDASVKQWLQLLRGRTLCIVPEAARLDPAQMVALLKRHAVDVLDCTPSQLRRLLHEGLASSPVSIVLVGGEAIDAATWGQLGEVDRIAFFNVYGPTECTVDTTAIQVRKDTIATIGRPLANVRVRLLDAHGQRVPPGMAGEIWIGGAGVGRGYLAQPALTEARFIDDPYGAHGDRLYRSGDLARYLADGTIEYIGRCDHQLKVRGFRIEAGEIEAALLAHPDVAEAVVVAAEQSHLVAYLVLREGAADPTQDLRARLRRTLPEYMVPGTFVALPRLPLTRNGKVDRAALPAPRDLDAPEDRVAYEAPQSDIERTIATIWQSVLGVPRVGVHHNFFDLGGHSLLMVQVYEKLCVAFGRRFPLVELFRQPTVGDLARYLGQSKEQAPTFQSACERAQRQRQAMQRRQRSRKDGGTR